MEVALPLDDINAASAPEESRASEHAASVVGETACAAVRAVIRAGRDMSVVTDEVVKHLTALPGAEVEVSVEISATVKDGVSESVQRIVNENCKALKFRSHEFEESRPR